MSRKRTSPFSHVCDRMAYLGTRASKNSSSPRVRVLISLMVEQSRVCMVDYENQVAIVIRSGVGLLLTADITVYCLEFGVFL